MAAGDPIHGKVGGATFGLGGTLVTFASVRGWTVDLTADMAETTEMHATNDGKTRVAGIKHGTATVTCLYVAAADVQINIQNDEDTLRLYRTKETVANGYYEGEAKVTGWELSVDINDVETITYSFIFTDAVTIQTDTPA